MNIMVQTFSPPSRLSSLPLPEELVLEILLRLPTKAIARCRCVSKLWSSILRSQYFTKLFLTKSCARPRLLFAFQDDSDVVFFWSPQPENPKENSYVVAANQLARFPSSYGFYAPTSGFFCYAAAAEQTFEGMKVREFVPVIGNPSTGQSLTLPRLKPRIKQGVDMYLGYDPIAKQLKVLSIEFSYGMGVWISARHKVLTLGTNKLSWRLVKCSIPPHLSSPECMCISIGGVLYYTASANSYPARTMVVCFDLRSEKFSFVNFSSAMIGSPTLVNYNGKLGLLMFGDYRTNLELWVLQDAEWSKHVYVLPLLWKDVVTDTMCITGMVGTNEIVLFPLYPKGPAYVIYYNVERKTIRKVWIQGVEAFQGKRFYTYLNYVENVKLL